MWLFLNIIKWPNLYVPAWVISIKKSAVSSIKSAKLLPSKNWQLTIDGPHVAMIAHALPTILGRPRSALPGKNVGFFNIVFQHVARHVKFSPSFICLSICDCSHNYAWSPLLGKYRHLLQNMCCCYTASFYTTAHSHARTDLISRTTTRLQIWHPLNQPVTLERNHLLRVA